MIQLESLSILDWEQLLNTFTKKRYHIIVDYGDKVYLVEVEKIGKNKILTKSMRAEDLKLWIINHIEVSLNG